MLTVEQVRHLFDYNPFTGTLTWKNPGKYNSYLKGEEAGFAHHTGYRSVVIEGVTHQTHNVIWLWVYGKLPQNVIDHKNHTPSDNRLANLRDVPEPFNKKHLKRYSTNSSGVRGVVYYQPSSKWKAYISVRGKLKHLGTHDTIIDAVAARKRAEKEYGYHDPEHPSNG